MKPLAFDNITLAYAHTKEPLDKANVLIKNGVQSSKPSVIVLGMPGHSDKIND